VDRGSAGAALKSRLSLNGSGPHLRLLATLEASLGSGLDLNGSGPHVRLLAALEAALRSRLNLNGSGPDLRLVAALALAARTNLMGDSLNLRSGGDGVTGRCAALSVLPALTLSFGLGRLRRLSVWSPLAALVGRRIGQSGRGPDQTGRRGGDEKVVALHVEGS
jgi:hypothetical protein